MKNNLLPILTCDRKEFFNTFEMKHSFHNRVVVLKKLGEPDISDIPLGIECTSF